MNSKRTVKISKFLSFVLRHEPESIGIALDDAGWVGVRELLDATARHGMAIGDGELREVVATNDKKRFEFNDDGSRIRASQGHSVEVELGYQPTEPPEVLYHGTAEPFLASIRLDGIHKGERHHVHLSTSQQTAQMVGQRRGRPVLLAIRAGAMHRDGLAFFISTNGVWLTDHVPARYIEFPEVTS